MAGARETLQRITRLTPLAEVLAAIERLAVPVAARDIDLMAARGRVLAADVRIDGKRPATSCALRDGFAVKGEETADATSYAPAALPAAPPMVDVGARLPLGADAVAPPDAVDIRDNSAVALAPIAGGDGVLPAGADADPDVPLRRAGEVLRTTDLAVLAALGVRHVNVCQPRVKLISARGDDDAIAQAICALLADRINAGGGDVIITQRTARVSLASVFAGGGADAIVVVGGSGSGLRDHSVHALREAGRVEAHGIAIMPGETTAFGMVGVTPVLIVPGRVDAALAAWLLIGRHLLAQLAGGARAEAVVDATLARKIASIIGVVELMPVRHTAEGIVPLASGYLPLQMLAQATGYVVVPTDSEGFPAGATVGVRKWP